MNRCCTGVILMAAIFAASAETLSLHDAQQSLVSYNYDLQSSQMEIRRAEAEVAESRSAWLPSLDARASYQWLSERTRIAFELPQLMGGISIDRTIGTNYRAELGVDLTWPLFTGFARKYSLDAKREQTAMQREIHSGRVNRLSFTLGILYLQWALSFREVDLKDMLCNQLATFSRQVESQFEAGTVIRSRVLEARARKQLADVDLEGAKQKTDSLRSELLSFINSTDTAVVPDTNGLPAALSAVTSSLAIDTSRPELSALRRSMRQITFKEKILRNRHFPILAGLIGVRYANPGLAMGTDDFMGYGLAGLQLNWNLFDGMKGRVQVQQLRYGLDILELERRHRLQEFEKAVNLSVTQIEHTTRQLKAAREATAAAEALAADLEDCAAAGTATHADYLNALCSVTQARLVESQLSTSRQMAVLKALFAAGTSLNY